MDIKQMVEKLKKEMPKNLKEKEIAKFIYIELGKEKCFDERYFFGNSRTRNKIYKLAQNAPKRINETMKNKRVVCESLSYLYKELLRQFDIRSYVKYTERKGDHVYVVICLKDGSSIKADLQLDLPMIHAKMKTKYFGATEKNEEEESLYEISDEENIAIDKKINYIRDEKEYRDKDIESIRNECDNKSPIETSEVIIRNNNVNNLPTNMGYVDRSTYYVGLFRSCIPRDNFDIVHCYRYIGEKDEDGEEIRKYRMILSVYDKKKAQSIYTFSESENRFIPIQPEILKDISFNENRESDLPNTTYWSRAINYPGAKKMMHFVKENEKTEQENNQDDQR